MEPEVRYCTTVDGVSIAYGVAGSGRTVVRGSLVGLTHVERDWVAYWRVAEAVTREFRLVTYDARGSGMSDRSAMDFSLEAMDRDLEAVVAAAECETFPLFAFAQGVAPALHFAATRPDRVTHLLLIDPILSGPEQEEMPQTRAGDALMQTDWDLYVETTARVLVGIDDSDYVRELAALIRASLSQEAAVALRAAAREWDVNGLLGSVKGKTLVVRNKNVPWSLPQWSQRLASQIPGARLTSIDDRLYATVAKLLKGLISEGSPDVELPSPARTATSFRTVLFTDLVGHTEMMSRLGDARGRDVLREHERITREVLKANGGTEVKTMGDGFMASFGSITKAVECAIALQRAFADREGEPLNVRVGLNAGEPIEEDGDLFGATVILASRIAAKADGGEILVADTVRGLCSGKGFLFADRGEFVAKGFEDPVRVYEVSWQG